VTIGNFDGVHKGHQALLKLLKAKAQDLYVPTVVITFEPQTSEYFTQGKAVPRLTRWREKFNALAGQQVDAVLVLRFNAKLAALSADEFIDQVLVQGLGVKHIMVGDDFKFGKARQGDFAFLEKAGVKKGFTVAAMESVVLDNERISSTRVRKALENADNALATKLLGRPYTMEGRVMHGDKLGREIGFPTANIFLHRKAAPVAGVYVVRMHGLQSKPLPGVANIGTRPTVNGTRSLLEVHLFDFNQDIYHQQVSVEFCEKLRDEERYDSIELLTEQIKLDALAARQYFLDNTF
jgi:riboflavin kinase/FMN adenylyltransferase